MSESGNPTMMTFRQRRLIYVTFLLCTTAAVIAMTSRGQAADAAKIELYAIQTVTMTDQEFLTAGKGGMPVTIAGELRLPTYDTPGRMPAVVIVHGSGGIMGNEDHWARELNEMGVAAFILDGFTARGIVNTNVDQSQLGLVTMINDAYRALDVVAAHPRIDPRRVGILGGSRGGRVALYASLRRFQRMYGTAGTEFAVYLPFYAPCYTRFVDDLDVADRPIRLFHGAADDYVPAAPCRAYVQRLRSAGKDVQLTEYPGAYHLFDNPGFPLRRYAELQTARHCEMEERPKGTIIASKSGRPFTWDDPCVERDVTVGYNAEAHAQATVAVRTLLKSVFQLP